MRKVLKAAKYVSFSLYAIGGVVLAVFLLPQTGLKALNVATGSMQPALPQGSLAIIRRVPYSQIGKGDVITFTSPANPRQTITHRVVEAKPAAGLPGFVTKGDANQSTDRQILGGNVMGKVIFALPYIGRATVWLRQPLGLFFFIVLPGILIIAGELKILWRRISEDFETAPSIAPEQLVSIPTHRGTDRPVRSTLRSLDGLSSKLSIILLPLMVLSIGSTRAELTTAARLTGNTLSTLPRSGHVLLNRISIGSVGSSVCPTSLGQASISNTGPGSTSRISLRSSCQINITNSNAVVIANQTSQTGGNNTSQINTTITIGDDGPSQFDSQWFELHNPTAQPVAIGGWKVVDNSGIIRSISAQTVPAGGYAVISSSDLGNIIGNGLAAAGDRLVLMDTANAAVDAVSWGSDSSQIDPPVPPIPVGGGIARKAPGYDTGTAADWEVSP